MTSLKRLTLPPPPVVSTDVGQAVLLRLIGLAGLLVGAGITIRDVLETHFPVDMLIYRDGVRAFMEGREMYSEMMHAGDVALPFIYPPFGALVMVPLTAPPFMTDLVAAGTIIVAGNLAILGCLYLVFKAVAPELNRAALHAAVGASWALATVIEPVQLNNSFAQINVIIMALVVADLVPMKRRLLPQGTLIGVAAAIKLTPLVFGLYWLIRRDVRSIITAAISAVTCTLVAALFRLDATVEFYFSTLLGMSTENEIGVNTAYQSNSSIKGMLLRFAPSAEVLDTHSTLINAVSLALIAATIGFGGWLMWALMRRGLVTDAILINALIALLISPVSWSHHWVWLALIIPVCAWRSATYLSNHVGINAVLLLWTLLIVTRPPKWWFGDAIDVHALNLVQKILVSDFVWLAFALMAAVAVSLRARAHTISEGPHGT